MPRPLQPVWAPVSAARGAVAPAAVPAPVSQPELLSTGFLREPQVLAFIPISKSTLWRRVQARTFPEPVKLSVGITAWRAEDIRSWIEQQGPTR